MAGFNKHLTIITLNVNVFKSPVKLPKLEFWIKKRDPAYITYRDTPHPKGNT